MASKSTKESVLAIALLLLLLFLYSRNINFIYAASLFIFLCLLFKPLAAVFDIAWKKLTHILGSISSTIILSVLFYGIVFPMGMILKITGKNPLILKNKGLSSTFNARNKLFTNNDLQNPY